MNLHLWVTYSGDHSLAKLGAIFTTSLPFDVAHVVGNVVFCLVFGPALVRALAPLPAALRGHLAPRAGARGDAARRVRPRGSAPRRRPTPPSRALAELARAGAERRRRLRRRARPALERDLHELGGARPRRRRAQPARRPRSRGSADVVAYLRAHPPRRSGDIGDTTRAILLLRAAGVAPRIGVARPGARAARQAPRLGRLRQPRQHDRVRDLRPARGGAVARRPRGAAGRALDRAARPTPTAASTSPAAAAARGSTTPARRCRGSWRPGAAARRRSAAPRASSPAARTPTAATRCSPAAPRTRSPPRGRSRRSSPPGATPTASVATAPARRSPTCARSSRQRRGPLLPHQRADAGLGHRAGRRRARPPAVPARGRARAAGPAPPRRRPRSRRRAQRPRPRAARAANAAPSPRPRPLRRASRAPDATRAGPDVQSGARLAGYLVGRARSRLTPGRHGRIRFPPLRIGVPTETAPGERRVALVPDIVRKLVAAGHEVRGRARRGRRRGHPGRRLRGGRRDARRRGRGTRRPSSRSPRPPRRRRSASAAARS